MHHPAWPNLLCPFPTAINPHAQAVQSATAAWAAQIGLLTSNRSIQRFERAQYGILMARAYPTARMTELQVITDWNTWLFAVDDAADESGLGRDATRLTGYLNQLSGILHGAPLGDERSPVFLGAADLARRLRACGDLTWLSRLLQRFRDYCAANVWEATNRSLGRVPSVAEYSSMRMNTGAVYCYLTLIELAARVRLPEEVLTHPAVRRLEQLTNQAICWSNDVISCEKEARHGDVHNLVLILHSQGCTFTSAQAQVVDRYNAAVQEFLHGQKALPSFDPALTEALDQYVAGMRFWMRANLDWSATTVRYAAALPASVDLAPLVHAN